MGGTSLVAALSSDGHPAWVPDVAWFATDQEQSATAEDIDRELHDAWLDFDSVIQRGNSMTIEGYREWPVQGRWLRVGRYPVVLSFNGVSRIDMHDPHGLGGIDVCGVESQRGKVTLTSCYIGHLSVSGDQLAATVTLSGTPSVERRWLRRRWEPTER